MLFELEAKKVDFSLKNLHINNFYLSVEGFSLKFEVLNITGFLFYSIYNGMSYFGHYAGAGNVYIYFNHKKSNL